MRKKIFQFILLILVVSIVINPTLAINSAKDGAYLWFNTLLPSLLPFLILSQLFISSGAVDFFGNILGNVMKPLFNVPGAGVFPLLVSSISGYPIGAKLTSDLRKNNYITRTEGNRLISFTSTSGPLFILGSVLIGMLNMPKLGMLMILPHYLGIISIGIIFRFFNSLNSRSLSGERKSSRKDEKNRLKSNQNSKLDSIGKLVSQSVKEGMDSIILIGGFVIIYSVIIEIFLASKLIAQILSTFSYYTGVNIKVIEAIFAGFLELTTGCMKVSLLNISPLYKILILNSIIAWGGLSILSQAISFINQTDISIKIYLFSKVLHSIFTCIYTYILYIFKYQNIVIPSSNILILNTEFNLENWVYNFSNSTKLALSICICFIILSLISNQLKPKPQ